MCLCVSKSMNYDFCSFAAIKDIQISSHNKRKLTLAINGQRIGSDSHPSLVSKPAKSQTGHWRLKLGGASSMGVPFRIDMLSFSDQTINLKNRPAKNSELLILCIQLISTFNLIHMCLNAFGLVVNR